MRKTVKCLNLKERHEPNIDWTLRQMHFIYYLLREVPFGSDESSLQNHS